MKTRSKIKLLAAATVASALFILDLLKKREHIDMKSQLRKTRMMIHKLRKPVLGL